MERMYPALIEDMSNDEVVIIEAWQIYENVLAAFYIYLEEVRKRYFNVIWVLWPREKIMSKGVVAWREKRAVFHFWILKELTDAKFFPLYPNVF